MNQSDFSPLSSKHMQSSIALSCACHSTAECEVNEDFILPDFLPDSKKLLIVDVSPRITEYSSENGILRYTGELCCTLLYVSDTNRLRAYPFTAHFSGKEAVPDSADQRLMLLVRAERNDSRMLSPRKLSLRLTLELQICVLSGQRLSCSIQPDNDLSVRATLEQLSGIEKTLTFTPTERMGLPLREDVELDGNLPTVHEIIACRMEGISSQVTVEDGKAEVNGDILVRCLYETDLGNTHEFTKRYTVHETVEIPDARAGMSGMANLTICGVQATAQNNSFGEKRVIELDAEIDMVIWCFDTEEISITRDAYSTAFETECRVESPTICQFDGIKQTGFSVNYSAARSEINADSACSVFAGSVLPGKITVRYDADKGKYLIEGKATATFLAETLREEEYSHEYHSIRTEIPIRGEMPACPDNSTPLFRRLLVSQARLRSDDSKFYADFEVSLIMPTVVNSETTCVTDIQIHGDSPHTKEGTAILLYYPSQDDTLWSIAKQYQTLRESISAINQIEKDITPEMKVIFIPNV